jgi:hypothetical protein
VGAGGRERERERERGRAKVDEELGPRPSLPFASPSVFPAARLLRPFWSHSAGRGGCEGWPKGRGGPRIRGEMSHG